MAWDWTGLLRYLQRQHEHNDGDGENDSDGDGDGDGNGGDGDGDECGGRAAGDKNNAFHGKNVATVKCLVCQGSGAQRGGGEEQLDCSVVVCCALCRGLGRIELRRAAAYLARQPMAAL